MSFEIRDGQFWRDGAPFQILAAELHYPRIPRPYWEHRIRMAKAAGLNTISIYCFWNWHEEKPGRFNFRGDRDVAAFVRLCAKHGLAVIVRPGPYVCAEWDWGGFPWWLSTVPGCVPRTDNQPYLELAQRYLTALANELAPLECTKGGPVIMVQVENEYGSFGSDQTYMAKCLAAVKEAGFTVPLFTCDGETQMPRGSVPGILPGWNGGSWPKLKEVVDRHHPGGPYFVPELYPGWLCHWGETFPRDPGLEVSETVKGLYEAGASFTLYMFHGGTNFGFWNGANTGPGYQPDLTSYDYDAPCDEAGRATPKLHRIRAALGATSPLPEPHPVIEIPPVPLEWVASVFQLSGRSRGSSRPLAMEELGQGHGWIRYDLGHVERGELIIEGLRDFATVFVDFRPIGSLHRRLGQDRIQLPGSGYLTILVENCGRINYGPQMLESGKGIIGGATLDGEPFTFWNTYTMPMKPRHLNARRPPMTQEKEPGLWAGSFELEATGDTWLDMRGWGKGAVWVNGKNLGRYWSIGPQQTLYLPGCWLKKGRNRIQVFESLAPSHPEIAGLTEPILDDLRA